MKGVTNVAEFLDPTLVPNERVRVAAFDGENADPANGRPMGDGVRAHTPWRWTVDFRREATRDFH